MPSVNHRLIYSAGAMKPSAVTSRKVLLLVLLALLILVATINELHLFDLARSALTTTPSHLPPPPPHLRILIGVVTMADRFEVRQLHRLVHSLQPPTPAAQIDIKYVFCRLSREEQRAFIALEILRYDDIIILDCPKENMNSGKTYRFFSAMVEMYGSSSNDTGAERRSPYDYVMKTDDDAYHRFPALVESLRPLPREDLYYGHLYLPRDAARDRDRIFMCGMGYVLSWDIVQWIATSEFARNNSVGHEDKMVGKWLREGGRGRNVHDTRHSDAQLAEWWSGGDRVFDGGKYVQYDLLPPPMRFVPNTISVHRLKDNGKWAQTLRYFNASAGLKESIFYDVSKIRV